MEFKKVYDEFISSDFFKELKKLIIDYPLQSICCLIVLIVIINTSIWNIFDGLITIGTLLAVLINIYIDSQNRDKALERIKIKLKIKSINKEIVIDENLTRKDCQRSEIQGILRTKLKKGLSFYDIDYLKEHKYFDNIYDIQIAKTNILTIELQDDELEQFGITQNDIYETNI